MKAKYAATWTPEEMQKRRASAVDMETRNNKRKELYKANDKDGDGVLTLLEFITFSREYEEAEKNFNEDGKAVTFTEDELEFTYKIFNQVDSSYDGVTIEDSDLSGAMMQIYMKE